MPQSQFCNSLIIYHMVSSRCTDLNITGNVFIYNNGIESHLFVLIKYIFMYDIRNQFIFTHSRRPNRWITIRSLNKIYLCQKSTIKLLFIHSECWQWFGVWRGLHLNAKQCLTDKTFVSWILLIICQRTWQIK